MAAGRLRYDAYIAEQGKPYPEVDHVNRVLVDELDDEAAIILVGTGDVLAGTVRANWLPSDRLTRRYDPVFRFERFAAIEESRIAICSRLAVARNSAAVRARRLLFETIYEIGLSRGTGLCFVTCAPMLLRLFLGYGFRECAPPIIDPIVGTLHRTLLVLDDIDHLDRVKSPFHAIALRHGVEHTERPWLTAIFEELEDHADA